MFLQFSRFLLINLFTFFCVQIFSITLFPQSQSLHAEPPMPMDVLGEELDFQLPGEAVQFEIVPDATPQFSPVEEAEDIVRPSSEEGRSSVKAKPAMPHHPHAGPVMGGSTDKKAVAYVLKKLGEIHTQSQRIKKKQITKPNLQNKVMLSIEDVVVNLYAGKLTGSRRQPTAEQMLAARMWVVNTTSKAVEVDLTKMILNYDGKNHTPSLPKSTRGTIDFQWYDAGKGLSWRMISRSISYKNKLTVPAGGVASTWICFSKLEETGDVPPIALTVPYTSEGKTSNAKMDVKLFCQAAMKLKVERVGPEKCLALMTINGETNAINCSYLVDRIDEMATEKVSRCVLHWSKQSLPIHRLSSNYRRYNTTSINLGIGQIHACSSMPIYHGVFSQAGGASTTNSSGSYNRYGRPSNFLKVQPDLYAAIAAALESAYAILPSGAFLSEIENGDVYSKYAALKNSGNKIDKEDIDLVLDLLKGKAPMISQAALSALGRINSPEAIATLVRYTKSKEEGLSQIAITSLCESSKEEAHQAVLEALASSSVEEVIFILSAMQKSPQRLWENELIRLAKNHGDLKVKAQAIRVLGVIRSERLIPLLKTYLHHKDAMIRETAIDVLLSQKTLESEKIAMKYTLLHLRTKAPTPQMMFLLRQTREQKASGLLLQLILSKKLNNGDRYNAVSILFQIGDTETLGILTDNFKLLESSGQTGLLRALAVRSPERFRKEAALILKKTTKNNSSHRNLFQTICNIVRQHPTEKNIRLLLSALPDASEEKPDLQRVYSIMDTFSSMSRGAASARGHLRKLRDTSASNDVSSRARQAVNGINNRSPAQRGISHAKNYIRQKKYLDAIRVLSMTRDVDREVPDIYYQESIAYSMIKKNDDALKSLQLALKIDPQNLAYIDKKVEIEIKLGKLEEAIRTYDRLIESNPKNITFVDRKAQALVKLKQYAKAIETYDTAIQKDPKNLLAMEKKAQLLIQIKEYGKAIETYDQLLKLNPKNLRFVNGKAQALVQLKQYAKAIQAFDLLVKRDSGNQYALVKKTQLLIQLKRYKEAVQTYDQLLKRQPDNQGYLRGKAQVLMDARDFIAAAKTFGRLIELDPKRSRSYASRGWAYSMAEKFDKAAQDYQTAAKLDPKNSEAITGVALSHAMQGKHKKAVEALADNKAHFIRNPIYAYNSACVYGRLVDYYQKKKQSPENNKLIKTFQKEALAELTRSFDLGYRDFEWTKKDTDLKAISKLPDFIKLLQEREKRAEKK